MAANPAFLVFANKPSLCFSHDRENNIFSEIAETRPPCPTACPPVAMRPLMLICFSLNPPPDILNLSPDVVPCRAAFFGYDTSSQDATYNKGVRAPAQSAASSGQCYFRGATRLQNTDQHPLRAVATARSDASESCSDDKHFQVNQSILCIPAAPARHTKTAGASAKDNAKRRSFLRGKTHRDKNF